MIARIRLILLAMLLAASPAIAGDRVVDALTRATQYLISKQDTDGAWRSGVHGSFKDGPSLTPLVMTPLSFMKPLDPAAPAAYEKADRYLLEFSRGDNAGNFPLYTAAIGTWVCAMRDDAEHRTSERLFLERLRGLQLNRAKGWTPDDPHFGAWGYHPNPRRPNGGPPDPQGDPAGNISATVFAIGALKMARVPSDDIAWSDAMTFVRRCQNYADDAAKNDRQFDDGGFTFAPSNEAGNKPGAAGTDKFGRPRLHSYGSATADGVRCLLQGGVAADTPRVAAARDWLVGHFDATKNPGEFNDDRLDLAHATHFYWLWTAAHALRRMNVESRDSEQSVDWKTAIVNQLLPMQRPDGSWASRFSAGREDDPIVATSFATAALLVCTQPDGVGHPAPSPNATK